ncbi:DNA transfer protein [Campylobacter sp. RM12640]|uniref:plasmid mobilization protein n=1 Tax=unclassified Campylobacter TaxID=2593542 RepID=UPI001D8F629E|nr:DNA transfer protein [Campylobacter sp. RM12642]MBZ7982466.1 DNA transfer protein [Campylobacter sp. RM12640]MBZ7990061.1 DNA transfer protein [Campylobacter sp. RM12635]MBZ8008216.1 DNA transfer protein [Campylobacter sp. RM9334]
MKKNKIKQIHFRVTEDEYNNIKNKANNYNFSVSKYLYNIANNYPIKSITDQKVASDLLLIAGDIGRLGGLFKHWLVKNEDKKNNFSKNKSYEDIEKIVDKILDLQIELKEKAKEIIKNDYKKSDI